MRILSQDGLFECDWSDIEQLVAYNNNEAVGFAPIGHKNKYVVIASTKTDSVLMGEYSLKSQVNDVLEMLKKAIHFGKLDDLFKFPEEEEKEV